MMRCVAVAIACGAMVAPAAALDNGLALTPPMGWNPWNCFGVGRTGACKLPLPWTGGRTAATGGCHGFNESIIVGIAKVMAEKLKPAGYEYMSLDCGYSTKQRDAGGDLVVNTTRYPHGMAWLGEQIHGLGLKFGMYAAQGEAQCCSRIDPNATDGSGPRKGNAAGYYEKDAKLFTSWEVDYLKFDGCSGPKSSILAMNKAIKQAGRPMVYSINNGISASNADLTNMWRTTGDVSNTYSSRMNRAAKNNNATAVVSGRKGAWNDADMLETGNFFPKSADGKSFDVALGDAEGRTNFALWCLMKAPLILGVDLTNLTAADLATVTNKDAIAVSKDPLGEQGLLRVNSQWEQPAFASRGILRSVPTFGYQVWSGALAGKSVAAVLANMELAKQTLTLDASALPPGVAAAAAAAAASKWDIRDAFSSYRCEGCALPQSVAVGAHDVAMLILTPSKSTSSTSQ